MRDVIAPVYPILAHASPAFGLACLSRMVCDSTGAHARGCCNRLHRPVSRLREMLCSVELPVRVPWGPQH